MSRLTMLQKNGITNMVCKNEDCHTPEINCPCTIIDQCECPTLKEVIETLAHYKKLEEQGRLIITDEPRKPLVLGADTLYCPECGSDLMGGFPYTDDTEMFQCRYCGQWINEKEQPIKLAELGGKA